MKDKLFWVGGFAFIALMVTGMAQSSGGTSRDFAGIGMTSVLTTGMPLSTEICDNGIDDDGNGSTDCDDPACSASPLCNQGDICSDTTTDLFLSTDVAKQAPSRCTANATDSDGKDPVTPGCLTYYEENTCRTPVNYAWDECTNGTTLRERYTAIRDTKSCAQPTSLTRSCSVWFDYFNLTCPGDATPVCVTKPTACGGVVRNIGVCACPVLIAAAAP